MSTIRLKKIIPTDGGIIEQINQGSGDNGTIIKRFQTVDGTTNDVLQDTPTESGTAQAGTSSTITLSLSANVSDDFYLSLIHI
jgi:hypothetical protein